MLLREGLDTGPSGAAGTLGMARSWKKLRSQLLLDARSRAGSPQGRGQKHLREKGKAPGTCAGEAVKENPVFTCRTSVHV